MSVRSSRRHRCSSSPRPTATATRSARTREGRRGSCRSWRRWSCASRATTATGCTCRWATCTRTRTSRLLFIDFEHPNRVRVSGRATVTDDPALVRRYPGAQFAVHVDVDDVFPNCPAVHPSQRRSRAVAERAGGGRLGAARRVEVHADVQRGAPGRRPGSCLTARDCRDGPSSPSGRRSSSPPARTTATGASPSTTTATAATTAPVTSAATTPASTTTSTTTTEPVPPTSALTADPFALGVTAGDPDATSVVLWTKLTGDQLPDAVDVAWETSTDDFATVAASGMVTASAGDGHSLHVVAAVAGPVTYRFRAGGFTSATGRAAPAGPTASLKLAATTCQHFETGFYAAHRDLVEWAPDAVVFLGDFIYEGAARPVGGAVVRSHEGPEPTDLDGYRDRYARYLSDPDLLASRAACPWFVIWDDHEVENNYAGLTPQDPADQATFTARRPRRLRGVLGAHAAAHRAAAGGRRHDHLPHRRVRRPPRPGPARRPPVPQRPGLRRRHAVDRASLSGGRRPGAHHARRDARGVDGRGVRRVEGDMDGARTADRAHRPPPVQTGRSSTRTSGTATRRPATGCWRPPRPSPASSSC